MRKVNRVSTLYQLLTVNKNFFYPCVERLYRNPLQTIDDCAGPEESFKKFVSLLARFSPCPHDSLVDNLRAVCGQNGTGDASKTKSGSPFVDYFSYIQTFRFPFSLWKEISHADWVTSKVEHESTRVLEGWETLVRALTMGSPYLSALQFISIPCTYLDRYMACIGQMNNAEVIEVVMEDLSDMNEASRVAFPLHVKEAMDLTKALLARPGAHGRIESLTTVEEQNECKDFAQNCDAVDGAPKHPLQVQIACRQSPLFHWMDDFRPQLKELYKLLPKLSFPTLAYYDNNLDWRRLRAAPETFDLLAVTEILDFVRGVSKRGVLFFPPEGKADLLVRCRSLKKLHVALHRNDPHDQHMFRWAVLEKQDAMTKAVDRRPPSLVPLEDLDIGIISHPMQAVTMQILSDAIYSFGSTLKTVSIHHSQMSLVIDLSMYFNNLPELRRLELSHMGTIECSGDAFTGCPKLESLYLHDDYDDDGTLQPFGVWNIPSLVSLHAIGDVAFRLNSLTFRSMAANLKTLFLQPESWDSDGAHNFFSWSPNQWVPLPKLRELYLDGTILKGFQWSWLIDFCPRIEQVTMISPDTYRFHSDDPYPSFDESYLGTATNLATASPIPPLLSLSYLRLQGWRFDERFFLDVLPALAPNLRTIDVCKSQNLAPESVEGIAAKFKHLDKMTYFEPFNQSVTIYGAGSS
ncbi:hypothetical protein BGZ73_003298 [Actinomortierella ambigua]|nr:hypothetical protein BGZ73_003298 [Actinomortierella ambigua]